MDNEFIEPKLCDNTFTIFSKSGCPNCVKVKKILANENPSPLIIDCDDYLIEHKIAFLNFIREKTGKEYKTFPMVFYKNVFIGGFENAQKYKNY